MSDLISDSRFYMWRTLFALVHADDVVTEEEVRFMAEVLEDVPFSDVQRAILTLDTRTPQDIKLMFAEVTDAKDQAEFFAIARVIVHVDGDYGQEEQDVMLELKKIHMQGVAFESLVGDVDLSFEADAPARPRQGSGQDDRNALQRVRDFFVKK